ncbi:DUF6250 domain-containing protein [Flavicella sediminum]|uniref:DUF6250 domain-containing protein n=1 Tax=Flavicella sediminum TaxID=2585141 RepID=UPI001124348D|nr:DUF6250 domain-containing protein [Flavicella sediminum]
MKYAIIFLILFCICCKHNSPVPEGAALYKASNWVVEQQEGGTVIFHMNQLEITDAKGCTVWLKHKLKAPVSIQYDATVISNGGPFDRVSDLNCFWMANDPSSPNNFFKHSKKRAGKFSNYHSLTQYYVGYGGHNNSKTRFRRYNGQENRPLLKEHDLSDKKFMLVPNKKMRITLKVKNNTVTYVRDGEVIFTLTDSIPYHSGYFGIRTVKNHMKIENIKIQEF